MISSNHLHTILDTTLELPTNGLKDPPVSLPGGL